MSESPRIPSAGVDRIPFATYANRCSLSPLAHCQIWSNKGSASTLIDRTFWQGSRVELRCVATLCEDTTFDQHIANFAPFPTVGCAYWPSFKEDPSHL